MEGLLTARIILFVVLTGAGALVLWMARATASGRLGRNSFAGIRIPSTMASDEAWHAAHARAKRLTIAAGLVSIASGLFALVPGPPELLAVVVLLAAVAMVALLLRGASVGRQAALETVDTPDPATGPDVIRGHR